MTVETARAILSTSRRDPSRSCQPDHSYADRLAFEYRMARLRSRTFVRVVARAR